MIVANDYSNTTLDVLALIAMSDLRLNSILNDTHITSDMIKSCTDLIKEPVLMGRALLVYE